MIKRQTAVFHFKESLMSPYFSNEKSAFLFLFCIIFSGILPVAEPIFGSEPVGRTGGLLSSSETSAYEDQRALDAYKKRNAEIDSWIKDDEIPDHGNAALLYYQALLLQPNHDQAVLNKFYDVYWGADPNMEIKTFLGKWLPSMKISAHQQALLPAYLFLDFAYEAPAVR